MRALRTLLLISAFLPVSVGVTASAPPSAADAQARFAEKVVLNALDFRQGDLASLVDAKPLFTASGWADFLKRLTGFVDPEGAATFSSTFEPSGPAIAAKQDADSLTVTVPGVLKHVNRNPQGGTSTTLYRAEIDIRVTPSPFKVDLLVQRTCGGATTKSSCR